MEPGSTRWLLGLLGTDAEVGHISTPVRLVSLAFNSAKTNRFPSPVAPDPTTRISILTCKRILHQRFQLVVVGNNSLGS